MNFEKIQQLTDSIHRTVDAINEQCHTSSSAPQAEQPLTGEPHQNPGTFPTPNENESYGAPYNDAIPRSANPWWYNYPQGWNSYQHSWNQAPPMGNDYPTWWNHYPYSQMYRPSWFGGMPQARNYTPNWWNNYPNRQTYNRPWWYNSTSPQMNNHSWWNPQYPYMGYNPSYWTNYPWKMRTPESDAPRGEYGYPPYYGATYPPMYAKPMQNYGGYGWNWYPPYNGYRNPSMMNYNYPYGWYGPNPTNPTSPPPEPGKNPFVLHGPWGRPNSYDYGMGSNMMNYYPPMPNSWETVDIPLAA